MENEMARFLDEKRIGSAIREVVGGEHVRCAVAFWGDGACHSLFRGKRRARSARIICDLTMGGTNPAELEVLGAPTNKQLKHIKGLHAKLYLSDRGLVIASANASNRGIGFVESAALIECGVSHGPTTAVFKDAAGWFEQLWERSHQVDPAVLDDAKRAWVRRPRHGTELDDDLPSSSTSLLVRIASDPEAYRGVGVVFTSGEADTEDVYEAYNTAVAADDELATPLLSARERERLRAWPKGHLFTGWSDVEVNAWPKTFLCVHRGTRGAVSYWCYSRFADARLGEDECSLFATPSAELRKQLGMGSNPRMPAKADADLLGRIFRHLDKAYDTSDGVGHRLCESPAHLARLLEKVAAAADQPR